MANGVLGIIDLWSSVYDNNDVLHVNHVYGQQVTRGNVLHSAWSLLGKSNTLRLLDTGAGMRNEIKRLSLLLV